MLTDMMKDELVKGLLNLFHENLSMIILYGSVARNEATSESDIDIAIITKNDMNEEIRNKFICWSAEMDIRYDKIFSIIDIKEENMKKWGKCFHFIRMYKKRGLFFGRQLKRTCTILAPVEHNIICFTGAFLN